MTLSLGFSPCPNDCFMFDAIVHRRIDTDKVMLQLTERDATLNVMPLNVSCSSWMREAVTALIPAATARSKCVPLVGKKRQSSNAGSSAN